VVPSNALALTIIPTFNEVENLEQIVSRLLGVLPSVHVLVVDDGSPDGTGMLADQLALADERIHAIHRTGKLGLGSAYLAGFAWGLERGYGLLIEMDADGSHPPESLPAMIDSVVSSRPAGSDDHHHSGLPVGLAIGSRWVAGGEVVDWPKSREALSRSANLYARIALGIAVRDATAGFRVYRAEVLKNLDLSGVDSRGYCFQIDLTLRTLSAGYRIVEVPITFKDRERGESKMSKSIVFEAMAKVTLWGARRRFFQFVGLFRPKPADRSASVTVGRDDGERDQPRSVGE
jgi:dolichol-phosphate mannosyltransferase